MGHPEPLEDAPKLATEQECAMAEENAKDLMPSQIECDRNRALWTIAGHLAGISHEQKNRGDLIHSLNNIRETLQDICSVVMKNG